MEETHQDKAFLEMIIKLIVTEPGEVEITRTVDDLGVLITLKVAAADMGRVIGKDGQTAKAIRTLLRAIGSRNNIRVNMKILEPEGGNSTFEPEAAPAPAAPAPEAAPAAEAAPAEAPAPAAAPAEAAPEAPAEEAPAAEPAAPAESSLLDEDDGIVL